MGTMGETPRRFDEKTLTLSNGLRLHYYEWPGPRPNLVLLHPSSGYGRMWEWTANHLGERFHVFALDQRGHGDSDRLDGDYSAEEYAEDLRLFCQQVGIDKAVIAGHSLGGRVAMVFAALYPRQTQALGLVGGPHMSNFFPTRDNVVKVLAAAQRMLDSPTEFASPEAALEYLRAARPRDPEAALRHRLAHNFTPQGSGLAVKYDKVRVALGLAHMADDMRKYAARTSCPVAILRGSRGTELTREEAESVVGCWKDARIIDVEADYALQLENPAGLAEALVAFATEAVKD
jgi:pimeloyl-ACP methyl ester carboxylesterase